MKKKKAQKSTASGSQHAQSDEPCTPEYERTRNQRIMDNRAKLEALGIDKKAQLVLGQTQKKR